MASRLDPVTSYADQVVRKKEPAGRRGLAFDAWVAEDAIEFFTYLRHSQRRVGGAAVRARTLAALRGRVVRLEA